jgi:hypothetical protein
MALTKTPIELSSTPGIVDNSNATAITIDSSENVMVNRTSVFTTAKMEIQSDASDALTLALNSIDTDGSILEFYKAGTAVGAIATWDGDLAVGQENVAFKFNDGSNEILPWSVASNLNRDNAFNLGSSSSRFKDLYLSGGAYLGGTAAANKLEDYEEGTWTPTVVTGTVSALNTWYTKVGNVVTVGGLVYNFSDRTSANQVMINNLPFTSSATVGAGSVFFRHVNTTADQVSIYVPGNSTSIDLWGSSFASTYVVISHSQLNSADARVFFSMTYQTA